MVNKLAKKLSVAILAAIAAMTLVFGATTLSLSEARADQTKSVEDIIDLSQGPNASVGHPAADGASNLIKVHFKGVNMSDGSFLENLDGFNDKLVIGTDTEEKTVAKWMSDANGARVFRIAVYGAGMYIQCESEATVLAARNIRYITFKEGFALYQGTNGTAGDWVFSKTATTKVEGTDFNADLKLYVNFAKNAFEYATETLTVKTNPAKTVYEVGETFDPAGMTLEAVTATSGTKEITVGADMCVADLSSAGEKTVTVSYGGKTATVNVTVKSPEKIIESIAYKSGSASIEQNGSVNEITLNGLKITASYEGGETEEVDVTADMIAVDPETLGNVNGKIIYTVGTKIVYCPVEVTVTERTSEFTAANTYPIPLDGYYVGEDGGDRKLNDGGISIWFTTNAGFGKENVFQGLGDKWYSDGGFEAATEDVNNHVLINGETFKELNAEGAGLTRFCLGWYENGLFCLRIHTDGSFKYTNVETITLLKGFTMYNTSAQPLGVPTPCDYTFEAAAKGGDKMLIRKTERLEVLSNPEKTEYYVGDEFVKDGLTLKATYTDGGTAIFAAKDRMISYDFSSANDQSPVTVTYNGKSATVNAKVTVRPVTLDSIAVKDGAKLFLTKFSRKTTLTPNAKLVLGYSDSSTEEQDLTVDMISGYTNENVGNGKAIVTYKGLTCEIDYTVSEYDETSTLKGVKYGLSEEPGKQGGVSVELDRTDNKGLKALWNINKVQSAIFGKANGDLVTINGETVTSLAESKKVVRMWVCGTLLGFHIDDAEFMATVKNGAEICILPGFAWATNEEDTWGFDNRYGELDIIENAVVTKPMYFCFKNGKSAKIIEKVTLKGTPKTSYYKGDVINVAGLTLEVEYKGLENEEIPVTTEMCDYDFSESGEKRVVVSYEGKTVSFDVTVEAVRLTGIRIDATPQKTDYDFGIDNELVLKGLVVKAVYDNGTEEVIDNSSLSFVGFDSRAFGTQPITVKYGELTATFDVNVLDISKNKFLSVEYDSGATSYEASQHNSLVISFVMNGIYEDLGSFWGTDHFDYVADYMLINGRKVSELIKEGKVTRICTWASQIVIHLDTCDLVPATWVDKRKDPNDENDKALHYIEGVSEVVETVTFLPGFQWYTTNPVSSENWGNSAFNGAVPLVGAVLKEKIELTNIDGCGWRRELKKNENGEVAEDALTVVSLPDKLTYKVGEALNLGGMQILAKYADGGEVILTPNYSETEGYKRNEAGEQTITYTYNGITISFKVTVTDEVEEPSSEIDSADSSSSASGGGCSGSVGIGGFAVLGLAAAVGCLKKKKENS